MKALVLLALPLIIYGFGIGRDFIFDDIIYISKNELLHRPDAFRAFWLSSEAFNYYPLFWSLLRVQWLLWGDHAAGYHSVNLLVHCANVVLLWQICRAWRLPAAWWIAAIFAVHPINVQTLAWAAEQKNTWSFLFMALATLAFIKHDQKRDLRIYFISLTCFLAALACKTSTVCFPLFLLIYYVFGRAEKIATIALRLAPFFVASLVAGMTTIWFEKNRAGGGSLIATLDFWHRLEASCAAFWFYLSKALLPIGLTPMYQGWTDITAGTRTVIPVILLALAGLTIALARRSIRSPIVLGLGYYFLMLAPLLGFFDTNYFAYSHIADHWQYHALPGLIVAVTAIANEIIKNRRTALALGAGTVVAAATLASVHFARFENAQTLWTYTVRQNPDAWIAWYNLANDYADKREFAQAIDGYQRCLAIKPGYYRAWFNLGNSGMALNQFDEANYAFLKAREIMPNDPDTYVNRGVVLMKMARDDEACLEFSHALMLDPRKVSASVNLMCIELRHGRVGQADRHLHRQVVESDANSRRIANAITSSAPNDSLTKEALVQFAVRACELSNGQPDLAAASSVAKSFLR